MEYSIICATYNPDIGIIGRHFEAVKHLMASNTVEYICINNNSDNIEALSSLFKKYFRDTKEARLIKEGKPGLTCARVRGITETKTPWVIWFDDDNQPCVNYLSTLSQLIRSYDHVAMWGPGNVSVEYQENVPDYVYQLKHCFQEKHLERVVYGNSKSFQPYYPAGTGMAVRRDVLELYKERIELGALSAKDRTGKSLSSGGDTQIAYTATHCGYSVGLAPQLKLKHLITREKSNIGYIKRMIFGVYNTGLVHLECDPSCKDRVRIPSRIGFFYMVLRRLINHRLKWNSSFFQIEIARYLGQICSGFDISRKEAYWEVRLLVRALKLI